MLGDKIKEIRKHKKVSQKEFAKILGIPASTLANYENNHREPNADMIIKISKSLGVSPTDLFDWDTLNEEQTHLTISKIVGDESKSTQMESKISYSLISIFEFASKLYGDDLFINENIDFLNTPEYHELFCNISDLIENKINKLINERDNKTK